MSRLAFYRGHPLESEPESWADRWPCTAVLVSLVLLAIALAGGLSVCVLLDSLTKGG